MKPNFLLLAVICFVSLHSLGQKCLPVKCLITYPDTNKLRKGSIAENQWMERLWFYDDQGRILLDSSYSPDHYRNKDSYTKHYRYHGDTVFVESGSGAKTMKLKNKKGWVVESYSSAPRNVGFDRNIYNDNGTPKSMINHSIVYAKDTYNIEEIKDSFIYVKGNLISKKTTFNWGKNKTKSSTDFYTFYPDGFYKQKFDSKDKTKEIIFHVASDILHLQFYSQNLVKSVSFSNLESIYSYDYEFDKKGNITGINETRTDSKGSKLWVQARFEYSCK